MKSDKERLSEAIHALNQLYEVVESLRENYVFDSYDTDLLADVMCDVDKVLEGN